MRRGRGPGGGGRSSRRMTRGCATAARPARAGSPAPSCTPPRRPDAPVLTAITISPGHQHDGHHAAGLVDQQPESRRPRRVIGDTAYGNVEVREQLEQRQVSVLARLHTTAPDGQDAIPKDAFQIDLHRDPVSGPQGKTAKLYQHRRGRPAASGQRVARFPRATASPARCGRVAPPGRPAPDPHQPPRRPPSSRAEATRRPRRTRTPHAHPATHRAAARPDGLPLPRPHRSLPRHPKNRTAGRLDRRPGQPTPDRNRPAGLEAAQNKARSRSGQHQISTTAPSHTGTPKPESRATDFSSGLRRQ